jgi:hypothetical protein
VVRINESNKQLIDEPDIWSNDQAWAYPAACTNGSGTLGFTAFYGESTAISGTLSVRGPMPVEAGRRSMPSWELFAEPRHVV